MQTIIICVTIEINKLSLAGTTHKVSSKLYNGGKGLNGGKRLQLITVVNLNKSHVKFSRFKQNGGKDELVQNCRKTEQLDIDLQYARLHITRLLYTKEAVSDEKDTQWLLKI